MVLRLRCSNLAGVHFRGVTHWETAVFAGANIRAIDASGLDGFKETALEQGAVDMDERSWRRWRKAGYPLPTGQLLADSYPIEAEDGSGRPAPVGGRLSGHSLQEWGKSDPKILEQWLVWQKERHFEVDSKGFPLLK